MSKVNEDSLVRFNGKIKKISDLNKEGKLECKHSKRFAKSTRGKPKSTYFLDIKGTRSGWETNLKTCRKLKLKPVEDY